GRVLLYCHAGCSVEEVCAAAGLKKSDLFNNSPKLPRKRRRKLGPIVGTYDYRDADGNLIFQVCRHKPKDFSQRQPDGNGGWIDNIRGLPRVLYRLPELTRAEKTARVVI